MNLYQEIMTKERTYLQPTGRTCSEASAPNVPWVDSHPLPPPDKSDEEARPQNARFTKKGSTLRRVIRWLKTVDRDETFTSDEISERSKCYKGVYQALLKRDLIEIVRKQSAKQKALFRRKI